MFLLQPLQIGTQAMISIFQFRIIKTAKPQKTQLIIVRDNYYYITFPIRWMMCSMIMDITTKTKQTTATAHVGVCSKDLPPLPPAMILNSRPSQELYQKFSSQKEVTRPERQKPAGNNQLKKYGLERLKLGKQSIHGTL